MYFNSGRQFLPWKRSTFKHVEVDLLGRPCWSEQPLPELELEELELELETTFTAPCMAGRSYQVHGGAVATAPGRACFGVLAPMLPASTSMSCLVMSVGYFSCSCTCHSVIRLVHPDKLGRYVCFSWRARIQALGSIGGQIKNQHEPAMCCKMVSDQCQSRTCSLIQNCSNCSCHFRCALKS